MRAALLLFLAVNLYAMSLRVIPVPTTILMVQRSLGGEDITREWTPLEEISPYIVEAVMGGEDSRFCEHEGIDWDAIEQAFENNQEGGRRRGGSTITQQTAKNVFFWNGGGYIRKAGEAWFASLIDFAWGKSRVMEVYLNVAEWGDGIFGVEAAAQARFGKTAKNLTPQEAALLAAVLPSPNKWRLDPPTDFVRERSGVLRKRMTVIRSSNYAACVTGLAAAKVAPKQTKPSEPETPPVNIPSDAEASDLEDMLDAAEKSLKKDVSEKVSQTEDDQPAADASEDPIESRPSEHEQPDEAPPASPEL